MRPEVEQRAAKRLLEAHERGLNLRRALGWTWKPRALFALILSVGIVGAIVERGDAVMMSAFLVFAGVMLGAMLRDIGWARAHVNAWPLTDRITDWDRVRGIAGGTEVGEPPRHS